jgi:glyoxylase-like metal-dependent hydrolase (beta-lactamase superfamily II)
MKRRFAVLVRAAIAGAVIVIAVGAVTERSNAQQQAPGDIRVLPIRGNTYMIAGAGANITVSVGRDGVLMVDSGLAQNADRVLAALQQLQREVELRLASDDEKTAPRFGSETRSAIADRHVPAPVKPIRYIVNTAVDPAHTGGNVKLGNSGRTFTGGNVAGNIADAGVGAAILAHENVLVRMSQPPAGQQPAPADALPTDTYYKDTMKLSHFFNGEGVQLIHVPKAHSDGDSIVVFRGSDVIAAGDVYLTESYPMVDTARGGTINGTVDALNQILDLSIAEFRTEGGTLVVPGRGRISDSADVAFYRDMVTIIRDRVQDMVKKGMTLEQVKAAKPTADYEPRYGATSGDWTTDRFLDAVYTTLGGGSKAAPATRRPARTTSEGTK